MKLSMEQSNPGKPTKQSDMDAMCMDTAGFQKLLL